MSLTEKNESESLSKTAECESQSNIPDTTNHADQPLRDNEKQAIKLGDGPKVVANDGDNTVISHGAIDRPAVAADLPIDSDQSEKEQSDDSQPNSALKRTTTSASEKPYSAFTTWQKRFIILAASTGSFVSPLTSNIYYPALNTIASDLHVTISQVNLTITTYMVGNTS